LYCCYVISWHRLFICWKELKEVKENMNSNTLFNFIRKNVSNQHCGLPWFSNKENRLNFLKECLDKFK
jgi:hypothetical protein